MSSRAELVRHAIALPYRAVPSGKPFNESPSRATGMSRLAWPGYAVGSGILIAYGLGLLAFKLIHVLVWLFGPWGFYTLIYGLAKRGERAYYVLWGIIMIFLALLAPAHQLKWPLLPIIGILILLVAMLAAVAYLAGRRGR